jgi:uncharacterized protein YbaA (DUF1428 family)
LILGGRWPGAICGIRTGWVLGPQLFATSNWRKMTMSYIDGFVIAVPTANKQKFIEHAGMIDTIFTDLGATRVVECWADDVPEGKITDFGKAVQATADESVVFSWIEWPDKETRDAAMKKMMSEDFDDERMNMEKNPMPFDGKRLIFGGFEPVVEL